MGISPEEFSIKGVGVVSQTMAFVDAVVPSSVVDSVTLSSVFGTVVSSVFGTVVSSVFGMVVSSVFGTVVSVSVVFSGLSTVPGGVGEVLGDFDNFNAVDVSERVVVSGEEPDPEVLVFDGADAVDFVPVGSRSGKVEGSTKSG